METAQAGHIARSPRSFWVVSALGLIWNAFGVYLYVLARLDPDLALTGASPAMREYVLSQPLWANIGYSLGIWGSFLGSVAMLLRSRHAVSLFAISLGGAIASHTGQAIAGVMPLGLATLIILIILFLMQYSRNCADQGLIR